MKEMENFIFAGENTQFFFDILQFKFLHLQGDILFIYYMFMICQLSTKMVFSQVPWDGGNSRP